MLCLTGNLVFQIKLYNNKYEYSFTVKNDIHLWFNIKVFSLSNILKVNIYFGVIIFKIKING